MTTTYTQARTHLSSLCDKATEDREVIVIQRRGHGDVALIALDELSSLLETAHLLRSPANAKRLLSALESAKNQIEQPRSLESLRQEIGLK